MKKVFKYVVLVLLAVLTLSAGAFVFADTGGSGTGGTGGGTGHGTVTNPPSYRKSGFVFYIVDGSGNIVAEPKAAVSFDKYPDSTYVNYIDTRFGNRVAVRWEGSIQSCPAWNGLAPFNSNSSGNGGAIKNHLISSGANGKPEAGNFINYYWGSEVEQSFIDHDDYYLIIEPFIWTSLYKSNTYLGNVIGTATGWVTAREENGCPESSSNSTYTLNNLPNSMAFDIPVLGVPAPSNLSNKHSYADIKNYGYGIISVWSSELDPDIPHEPVSYENADAIKSNELNYIYKNFSGSRSGSKEGFSISKIDIASYAEHSEDTDWYIDDYTVSDDKSGDLWNFKGNSVLFYRPANCSGAVWAESTATKSFSYDTISQPQYSYNISRALWGDNLVLCNYYGATGNNSYNFQTYRDYAREQLGLETGNTGSVTGVSAGTNVDATYGVSKQDDYSFKGSTTEYWKENEQVGTDDKGTDDTSDDEPIYDLVLKSASVESDEISYSVTHYVDKYKTYDTGVVSSGNVGENPYTKRLAETGIPVVKAGFTIQSSDIISVYPEVAMKMYYTSETTTFYDGVNPLDVYVMGEYARKCYVPILDTYTVTFTSGMCPTGASIVTPATTGTNAYDLVQTWESKTGHVQDYMQVIYQGGTFEVGTTNNPKIVATTYVLDVQDETNGENLKSAWGNSFDGKQYNQDFAQAIADNTEMNVKGRYYNISGCAVKEYDFKDAFDVSGYTTEQNTQGKIVKFVNEIDIDIEYKDGVITNKNDIISAIKTYSAVDDETALAAYNSWGIEQVLDDMFVSSTDADNNSKDKFYDEESHSLCVKVYQTNVMFGNILLDDKVDFNTGASQDAYDISQNGKMGVQARFYLDLYFTSDYLEFDGYSFDVTDKHYLIHDDEIEGARFIISNVTTNDMIRR